MRVLVTGGAGFIGSHLCEMLILNGQDVSAVDDLNDFYAPEEKKRNIDEIKRRGPFNFFHADISDANAMAAIFGTVHPDVVVHLAARAGVRPSTEQPLLYVNTNVTGTLVLLEESRKNGVEKFIFASSSSVYGLAKRIPFAEEDFAVMPISPYAATKLAAEKLVFTYTHLYQLSAACLRLFSVYGPRQRPDLAIRRFTEMIETGQSIPIFGDGSSARDYTFVEDTVSGISAAIDYNCSFEVFNLGNSVPITLYSLIETIQRTLRKQARISHLPEQKGDVPITCADITKAQRLLGYRPQTAFEYGVEQFVRWQRYATANAS